MAATSTTATSTYNLQYYSTSLFSYFSPFFNFFVKPAAVYNTTKQQRKDVFLIWRAKERETERERANSTYSTSETENPIPAFFQESRAESAFMCHTFCFFRFHSSPISYGILPSLLVLCTSFRREETRTGRILQAGTEQQLVTLHLTSIKWNTSPCSGHKIVKINVKWGDIEWQEKENLKEFVLVLVFEYNIFYRKPSFFRK